MISENDSITITEANTCLAKRINAKVVNSINSIEETGINWLVAERPLCYMGNKKVKGYKILVRQDQPDNQIAIANDRYEVIQNSYVWDVMNGALEGVPFKVRLALSTDSLSRIAIQVELNDGEEKVNGDKFQSFFTFASSHDGTMPFVLKESATRAVCENTLAMAISEDAGAKYAIRHTKNYRDAVEKAKIAINSLSERRKEFYANLERFAGRTFIGQTREERIKKARLFLSGLYGVGNNLSPQTESKVDSMMDILSLNGIAISKEITMYDVLNAGTEFFTHYSADRKSFSSHENMNPIKQFESSEFGQGSDAKVSLYNALLSDERINALAARGEKLLAAPRKKERVPELVEA